ncbi:MAG: response regulator transcription factor, partial [Candidatus Kapaibacteriota bacterium]
MENLNFLVVDDDKSTISNIRAILSKAFPNAGLLIAFNGKEAWELLQKNKLDIVIADYDLGYFPSGVTRAYLRIRWFETDDFSIHYSEQYQTGNSWECRWDRHPNDHNTREHFHPPPDAPTPGEDQDYPDEW